MIAPFAKSLHSAAKRFNILLAALITFAAESRGEPKDDTKPGANKAGSQEAKAAEKPTTREFDGASFLPGMLSPPLLTFTLPADFVATPFGAKADMYSGVLWGTKETAAKVKKAASFAAADSAFFMIRLSSDVGQEEDGTFSHEKDLEKTLKSMGMKEVLTTKLKWGDYPVLTMTALRPDGTRAFTAWVGINRGSWVLFCDFQTGRGPGHPTEQEKAIWNDFLEKTKPVTEAESWKARGFDIQPGKTGVTLRESGIDGPAFAVACEERKRDKAVAFQLVPLDPAVSIHITSAFGGGTPTYERLYGVAADVTVSSEKVSLKLLDHQIPVVPKDVDDFSFPGKPIGGDESLFFFGGPRLTVVDPEAEAE